MAFEEEFATYLGVRHAITVSNGTVSLEIALKALNIGKGDEVITTPLSFVATGTAILSVGATPVFVDINPRTLNIDPEKIVEAITTKTRVILPVSLLGTPCLMQDIMEIADGHDIAVLEDACFEAETEIITNFGVKSIADIHSGDLVLTSNGKFETVKNTFKRRYNGNMVKLVTRYYDRPILVTPNHRFLAIKSPKFKNSTSLRKKVMQDNLKFIAVQDLEKGDFVAVHRFNRKPYITPPAISWTTKTNKIGYKTETVKITPDLMRLFGYYISEGSWSGNECIFHFNSTETTLINDCCELIRLFNRKPNVTIRMNCAYVRFSAKGLKSVFKQLFGSYARRKKIPNLFLHLPDQYIMQLLRGIFLGDASFKHNKLVYSTSSKKLAFQTHLLLISFDFIGALRRIKPSQHSFEGRIIRSKGGWSITIKGTQLPKLLKLLQLPSEGKHRPEFALRKDNYILIPIRRKEMITFNDYVYNLHVENNPTYCLPTATVHNCQALGASINGKKIGSFGDLGSFSFQLSKTISTLGEGGVIVTDDDMLADRCRHIRNHGNYYGELAMTIACTNARLSEAAAAFGRVQLQKLDMFNEIQIKNAEYFLREIEREDEEENFVASIFTPLACFKPIIHRIFMLIPVLLNTAENTATSCKRFKPSPLSRDELIQHLTDKGISKGIPGQNVGYYKNLIYDIPLFAPYKTVCPRAESILGRLILFDIHRWQDKSLINKCLEALREIV